MKNILFAVIILIAVCGSALNSESILITVEGEAVRSKGGLVVGSIMITDMTEEKMDLYSGKYLRVKGYVEKNHRWKVNENDVIKKQGFNMPAMTKVISVEVIEKK